MADMETFKVFGDQAVGRMFMPDGFSYEDIAAVHVSPLHGRSVALKISDFDWITVKGGGWNYGGPQVYVSLKDDELVFGLYSSASAQRELAVSNMLRALSDEFPVVMYYKKLTASVLPAKLAAVAQAKFSNGRPVEPCLLYTRLKCPCRVADLMYFTDAQRRSAVSACCAHWGVKDAGYADKFIEVLASRVAVMHLNGFINDTLDYGNVTLLAEIVDYEWVTAPGIRLPDGSEGCEISDERREKELLYGAEICFQLKNLLHEPCNLFDVYAEFIAAYGKINASFVEKNINVQKMLRRETLIL